MPIYPTITYGDYFDEPSDEFTSSRYKRKKEDVTDVKGLIAFYPNISKVPTSRLSEYLDRLANDNGSLIDAFNECMYEVIWLPVRGEKSSHMEIWPLGHSKNKLITFLVNCSNPHVISERRDKFCDYVLAKFLERHEFVTSQLKRQGFSFARRVAPTADNRIVVY